MFEAKVYKIAVLSLSGMMDEVYAAKEAVSSWNKTKAESAGKMYMLVDDLQTADILVGIIGNRIENASSVEDAIKSGKQVLLFFNSYVDPKNTIDSEHQDVLAYKESMNGRCIVGDYNGVLELNGLLVEQLDIIL